MIPLRKRFIIDLITSDGVPLYRVSFLQATFGETLEFDSLDPAKKMVFFSDFIEKNSEILHKDKEKVKQLFSENIEKFVGIIVQSRHKQRESAYKGIKKRKAKGEKDRKGTFGSSILTVIKEFNLNGLNDLLDNYTYEQFGRMIDQVIFQNYETSDEGQEANDKAHNKGKEKQSLTEEQKKIIDFYSKYK